MAKKKLSNLVSCTDDLNCGGCSVEEVVEMAQTYIKKLPPECTNITTNITSSSDGWSDKPILEISWQRPPRPEEIQAEKDAEARVMENKRFQYEKLKKELGL